MPVTEQSFTDARRTIYQEWRPTPRRVGAVALGNTGEKVPVPCAYSKIMLDEVEMYETGVPGVFNDLGPGDSFKGVPALYGVVVGAESREIALPFPATPQGESGQWAVHQFPGI